MKFLFTCLTLSTVSLMACTHSITADVSGGGGGGSPLPPASDKAAAGSLNGKNETFNVGSYIRGTDNNGAPYLMINLNGNSTDACAQTAETVLINVPAKIGVYAYPTARIMFGFTKADGNPEYDVSSNGNVNILTDDGTTITGNVRSSYGTSNVTGNFMALACGQTTNPPPPVNPPPPRTGTDPSQIPAIVASSWNQVHYAFCSAQGQVGVLVDFQGANLTTNATWAVRVGMRSCDGSQPFAWSTATLTSMSTANGYKFDFGPSSVVQGQENTIEVGPTGFYNGYGLWNGNSGSCTFLVNEATQGIYDQDPMAPCK